MDRYLASGLGLALALAAHTGNAAESDLWGKDGERWSAASRLPDYAFAGYHRGEKPIPDYPVTANVKSFGAKGDGNTDDTQAFKAAIAATASGAILAPAGRYKITDFITLDKPGVVLRGAGPDSTILWFPKSLQEIHPSSSQTSTGDPTTAYSFDFGFLTLKGDLRSADLSPLSADARRGDSLVVVASAAGISVGQEVRLQMQEAADQSLKQYLYAGDAGDIAKGKKLETKFVAKVTRVQGNQVFLDRGLPFDARAAWKPKLQAFRPTVRESGFERFRMEFPELPYPGHFKEQGFNGIEFIAVADCWVRDIRLHNADMGVLFVEDACFNTASGVTHTAYAGRGTPAGHHAYQFKRAQDNLATGFDLRVAYVHDLSVENASGNVYAAGKGVNLCFDHHEDTPFANLYVDLDAGSGTRVWESSGGASFGRHSAAWNTYWNIRAAKDFTGPPAGWGPSLVNVVAIRTAAATVKEPEGKWIEAIAPAEILPADIHLAQLAKRMRGVIAVRPRTKAEAFPRTWGWDLRAGTLRFGPVGVGSVPSFTALGRR